MKKIINLKRTIFLLICVAVIAGSNAVVIAQDTEEPVIHAVLFYSPSCPHCHEAINNVLIPLTDQYGQQLQILGIDVSTEAGHFLYQEAVAYYEVPDNRLGVPTLIVEDMVLVSTMEIADQFPAIIEAGLAAGGNMWPDFPGMAEIAAELQVTASPEPTVAATSTIVPTATEVIVAETAVPSPTPTPIPVAPANDNNAALPLEEIHPESIATTEAAPPADPVGFLLGWLVVLGLVAVVLFTGWLVVRSWPTFTQAAVKHSTSRSVVFWLLIAVGLIVSGYLAYVETMHVTAVCGPVGECNIVQSSSYARLLGVPIAVWGLLFYIATAVLWLLQRVEKVRHTTMLALVGVTLFGCLFSIYLTLLELLVIGAICAWCLTSAVVTGLLFLLIVTRMEKRPLPPEPQWQTN